MNNDIHLNLKLLKSIQVSYLVVELESLTIKSSNLSTTLKEQHFENLKNNSYIQIATNKIKKAGDIYTFEYFDTSKMLLTNATAFFTNENQKDICFCFLNDRKVTDSDKKQKNKIKKTSQQKENEVMHLLFELSSKFISINELELQDAIQSSLEELGKLVNADRFYIFTFDFINNTTSNTQEWCNIGISPEIENLQEVPFDAFPEWLDIHKKGKPLIIPDVNALEQNNEIRKILKPQGVKSIITVPLLIEEKCIGFIGLDYVQRTFDVSSVEIKLLTLFSKILVNIQQRFDVFHTLKFNKRLLTSFMNNSESIIYQKDQFGRYININNRFEEVTGISLETAIGKTDIELFSNETGTKFHNTDQSVIQQNNKIRIEESLTRQSEILYFDSVKFPIKNNNGDISGMVNMSIDITQLKKTQIQLQNNEALLTSVLESNNNIIFAINTVKELIYYNKNFKNHIKELNKHEIELHECIDIEQILQEKKWEVSIEESKLGKDIELFTSQSHLNKKRYFRNIISPIQIEGEIKGYSIFREDISTQMSYIKKIEEQNHTFKSISWLQSHEMRAPLTRLLGLVEINKLENGKYNEEIIKSAKELDEIIHKITEELEIHQQI